MSGKLRKNVFKYLAFVKSKELFIKRAQTDVLQRYIQPHLDYTNIVWGSTSKTNLLQIERL